MCAMSRQGHNMVGISVFDQYCVPDGTPCCAETFIFYQHKIPNGITTQYLITAMNKIFKPYKTNSYERIFWNSI
jgi:hypothetical protein